MAGTGTLGNGLLAESVVAESLAKEVQLGFVEDFTPSEGGAPESEEDGDDRDYLLPEFLPSKVGGKPSWIGGLIPELDESARACPGCDEPMPLLLQVYAPLDHINPDAYHRMILLLSCKKSSCHHREDSTPFRAFRVQLPRVNDYVLPELDELSDDEASQEPPACDGAEEFSFLTEDACAVCGFFAKKRCSKCKSSRYCSRQHQVAHWKAGHSATCNDSQELPRMDATRKPPAPIGRRRWREKCPATNASLFKQFEISTEAEDQATSRLVERFAQIGSTTDELGEDDLFDELEAVAGQEELNEELLKKHEENMKQYQGEIFDENEWRGKAAPDSAFALFQKVTEKNPDQVLRYCFGGTELWISRRGRLATGSSLPPCELCSCPRTFEMQVQPQLLYYLGMKEQFQKQSVDWGTVVIYSCASSCSSDSVAEEFVWRQSH